MKDENYITLQGWMKTRLHLTSDKLAVYAIIYGFSQDDESRYKGGYAYLREWTGKTDETLRKILRELAEEGLIIRIEEKVQGVVFVHYKAVIPPPNTEGVEIFGEGAKNLGSTPKNSPAAPPKKFGVENKDSNNSTLGNKKGKEKSTPLPLEGHSEEFIKIWAVMIEQPAWKKKTPSALAISFNKLTRYPDAFAVQLMEATIEHNWQGVVFKDTDEQFKQWQNANNGRTNGRVQGPIAGKDFDDTTLF